MLRPTLITALLVAAIYLFLSSHLEMTMIRLASPRSEDSTYTLPGGPTIAAASLNYRTAASDLVWINAILYASDRAQQRRSATEITDFADAITYLDPHFYPIYQWHSATRRMLNVNMTYEDVAEANRILKIGTEHFPRDPRLPFAIAANHLGTRYERTPEERLQDLEEIVHYAQLASERPGATDDVLLLATAYQRRLLRARAGLSEFADDSVQASPEELDFLLRRYHLTSDPQTQAFLLRRLHELGADEEVLRQTHEFREQFDRAHRTHFSYLSPDLFTLVEDDLTTFEDEDLAPL